jgi:hypothetical protein
MMRPSVLLFSALLCLALALPFREQIALTNSLEVGRIEDPMAWTCVGCDETNKPIHSYVIEEKEVEIRSILSVYDEYTVLAFRYTANAKNLWQDILWVLQTQDEEAPKGCKVQKIWDNMWSRIRDDVISGLRQHVHTRRLVITGISLGGALAGLSFVDIQATGEFDNIEVVTFGAPRVGNKKWAAWFDTITSSTRIYIRRDPIAFLPRCLTPFCNYRQTGKPIVCYPGSEECRCKSKVEADEEEWDTEFLFNELDEHKEEIANGDLEGILDHIYGYKKTINYSLIC